MGDDADGEEPAVPDDVDPVWVPWDVVGSIFWEDPDADRSPPGLDPLDMIGERFEKARKENRPVPLTFREGSPLVHPDGTVRDVDGTVIDPYTRQPAAVERPPTAVDPGPSGKQPPRDSKRTFPGGVAPMFGLATLVIVLGLLAVWIASYVQGDDQSDPAPSAQQGQQDDTGQPEQQTQQDDTGQPEQQTQSVDGVDEPAADADQDAAQPDPEVAPEDVAPPVEELLTEPEPEPASEEAVPEPDVEAAPGADRVGDVSSSTGNQLDQATRDAIDITNAVATRNADGSLTITLTTLGDIRGLAAGDIQFLNVLLAAQGPDGNWLAQIDFGPDDPDGRDRGVRSEVPGAADYPEASTALSFLDANTVAWTIRGAPDATVLTASTNVRTIDNADGDDDAEVAID